MRRFRRDQKRSRKTREVQENAVFGKPRRERVKKVERGDFFNLLQNL